MFNNKKGNMGGTLFLVVILFNIFMYILLRVANADALLTSDLGSYNQNYVFPNGTTTQEISVITASSWTDGFNVSVFNMPWWVNIFYVTFQLVIISLSIFMLIRGI